MLDTSWQGIGLVPGRLTFVLIMILLYINGDIVHISQEYRRNPPGYPRVFPCLLYVMVLDGVVTVCLPCLDLPSSSGTGPPTTAGDFFKLVYQKYLVLPPPLAYCVELPVAVRLRYVCT